MSALQNKYRVLQDLLRSYGKVAIAYSGGVDSSLLSYVAHETLGDNAFSLTADAPVVPRSEFADSQAFCKRYGIRQVICHPNPFTKEEVRFNAPNRCYVCKKVIFGSLFEEAAKLGVEAIADGSNLDDLGDYRPGLKALEELQVKSPLREASFTKADIRALSRELGLPTWNKQSNACLATRFPYGAEITTEKLSLVDKAESALSGMGFTQLRVRVHNDIARIEVPAEQMETMLRDENRVAVVAALKDLGFAYVTLDLAGYRTGSMNEKLGTLPSNA